MGHCMGHCVSRSIAKCQARGLFFIVNWQPAGQRGRERAEDVEMGLLEINIYIFLIFFLYAELPSIRLKSKALDGVLRRANYTS